MFISEAIAQTAGNPLSAGNGAISTAIQIALIFVVFYFVLIRPSKKKYEEQERMLKGISRGDKIIVGGIIGTVSKTVGDNELLVEIADDIKIKVLRSRVSGLYDENETNAVKDKNDEKGKKKASSAKLKDVLNDK